MEQFNGPLIGDCDFGRLAGNTKARQKRKKSSPGWSVLDDELCERRRILSRFLISAVLINGDPVGLHQLFSGTDQRSQSLGQQAGVKRLLERLVDCRAIEGNGISIVGQQCDQNRFGEIVILTQVLADLQGFDLPDREIGNDAVRVKTFGLNSGFETARCNGHLERFLGRQVRVSNFQLIPDLEQR